MHLFFDKRSVLILRFANFTLDFILFFMLLFVFLLFSFFSPSAYAWDRRERFTCFSSVFNESVLSRTTTQNVWRIFFLVSFIFPFVLSAVWNFLSPVCCFPSMSYVLLIFQFRGDIFWKCSEMALLFSKIFKGFFTWLQRGVSKGERGYMAHSDLKKGQFYLKKRKFYKEIV